jgi:glycerol-3-phosphate acyltransferase PlsX
MGGDSAPFAVIAGANLYLEKDTNVHFLLHGDETKISRLLKDFPKLKEYSEVFHTEYSISSHEKPSIALRQGANSSMRLAIDSVKHKEADAVISSGNSGALMAMSKVVLRPLPSIDRPAMVTLMPNQTGKTTSFLDMGANIECDSSNLCQFAVMGRAYHKAVTKIKNPTIGLLNIGTEDIKGKDAIKNASIMLKESNISESFYGYVEGDDILKGTTDVVVTDGFTGNVVLKAIEGTAKLFSDIMRKSFKESILSQLGYILARPSINKSKKAMDVRLYNGALFVGLNGIAVKSHGNADEIAFENAIKVTTSLIRDKINEKIAEEIKFSDFNSELDQYEE